MGAYFMRRWLYFLLIILNVIILSACNNAGEENNSDKNEQSVTPVETVEVKQGDLTVDKSIYGTVAPAKQTPVMVQQPGEITTLKVENGDKVKKDDHLATIKTAMEIGRASCRERENREEKNVSVLRRILR